MKFDETDYINELLFSIQQMDAIKVGVLVTHFQDLNLNLQRKAIFELSRADDNFALPFLLKIAIEHSCKTEEIPELKKVLLAKSIKKHDELHSLFTEHMITFEQFLDELSNTILETK